MCCVVLFLPNQSSGRDGNAAATASAVCLNRTDLFKWKFPWRYEQHWAAEIVGPLEVCMCESHVELQGNEVCWRLVWMRRMSPLALRESCSSIFCVCFIVVLCIYHCVFFTHFLQSFLLLCNQLFSRPQTFLSEDTDVCSVVLDMLGIQLLWLTLCHWCGCFLFFSLVLDKMMLTYIFHALLSMFPVPGGWLPWRWFSWLASLVC